MLQQVSCPWLPLKQCGIPLGGANRRGEAVGRGARVTVELEGGVVKAGWQVL